MNYPETAIPRFQDPDSMDSEDTRQCAFCDSHIPAETKTHECPVCLEEVELESKEGLA